MICNKCKEDKYDSEFNFRNKSKNIRHKICKSCKSDNDKIDYSRAGRKESLKKANNKRKIKIRSYISSYKDGKVCIRCGDTRPYVLEFHHLKDKEFNIAEATAKMYSIDRLNREINKCVLLCANCHKEIHYLNIVL